MNLSKIQTDINNQEITLDDRVACAVLINNKPMMKIGTVTKLNPHRSEVIVKIHNNLTVSRSHNSVVVIKDI